MGRVYDALRRSGREGSTVAPESRATNSTHRNHRLVYSARQSEEQFFRGSSTAEQAMKGSAFTAHTAYAAGGTALPTGDALRAAGATLNAARPTRVSSLVSYDVEATRVEPHLVAITQPGSAYCEQYRSLRTRVLQAGERQQVRTIVVTSAGKGDGKTLTTLNLAWLLAQVEGVRTLVIDSDLREPCATDYLAIDAPRGLSGVLGGELGLRDALVRLDPAGLYLLPGGQARDDVAELLSGPTFAAVIAEARRMFDFVIIDAPPLGIFTDANMLINRADSAIVVLRAGKTRYAMVDRLLEQLPRERMLGVVLNRADEQLEAGAYYYQQRQYRSNRLSEGHETLLQGYESDEEEVAIAS